MMEADENLEEELPVREAEVSVKKRDRHTTDVYIACGVHIDCQNILNEFLSRDTSTFEDFVRIWKEKSFSLIFSGRDSFAELLEFIEEVMVISKAFILPPHSHIKRIGALYLMYGLYTQQPTNGLVKYRVTPQEWSIILKFVNELKTHGFIDANYIFHKMCLDGAFLTTATDREYGLERNMRKYLMPWAARDREIQPSAVFSMETLLSRFHRNSVIADVNRSRKKYNKIKGILAGQDPSGSAFQPLPGTDLEIETVLQTSVAAAVESVAPSVSDRRKIKQKAFENQTGSITKRYEMSTQKETVSTRTSADFNDEANHSNSDANDEVNLPNNDANDEVNLPNNDENDEVNLPNNDANDEVNLPNNDANDEVNLPNNDANEKNPSNSDEDDPDYRPRKPRRKKQPRFTKRGKLIERIPAPCRQIGLREINEDDDF